MVYAYVGGLSLSHKNELPNDCETEGSSGINCHIFFTAVMTKKMQNQV